MNIFDKNFSKWSQLDEPSHENLGETKDEIIEAMLICNYLFRTGGQFSTGNKYRRKKGVLALKTKEGGLLYNPYLPPEKRKTDMFLNGIKVDSIYFEVLYRCDGYHNTEDLQQYLEKLFDVSANESAQKVNEIITKALGIGIIEEIPDVTDGENHSRGALFNGGGLI